MALKEKETLHIFDLRCRSTKPVWCEPGESGNGIRRATYLTLAEKEGLEKVSGIRRMNTMSIAEIEKMTTPERLRAMEALWDALCHEKTEPDSPEWHGDVLAQRRKRIESGEAKFFSIEEAKRLLEE